MIYTTVGDGISGEKIVCVFRKYTKPILIETETHDHRTNQNTIYNARCVISKNTRIKTKK
jgi:hypothetical protein